MSAATLPLPGLPARERRPSAVCRLCGRRLRHPASIARGIGPVCAQREAAAQAAASQATEAA